MARKHETSLYSGHMIWRLEHCEVVVLIDAWLRVKGRIPTTEHWTLDFEDRFFKKGDAVSERHLTSINRHLRRIGLDEVWFDETNVGEYVRSGDKATWLQDRLHIKESLQSMDAVRRSCFVDDAITTMETLEPAHRTYEEWREEYRPVPRVEAPRSALSLPPRPMAQAAVEMPRVAEPPHPPASLSYMPPELAFKLLEQTTDAEMKNQLVRVIAAAYGCVVDIRDARLG